jgi:hypothetical protein
MDVFPEAVRSTRLRPLAVLLGIVMGSTVSIAIGLAMTLVVFALLPEHADRIDAEFDPLLRMLAAMSLAAAAAVASFYGELRDRRWRFAAHALLAAVMALLILAYWPRGSA